jgi:hypothetical protein
MFENIPSRSDPDYEIHTPKISSVALKYITATSKTT